MIEFLDDAIAETVEAQDVDGIEVVVSPVAVATTITGTEYVEIDVTQLNASVYVTTDAGTDPNIPFLPPGTAIIQIS
jgi:hypothetical protein